MAKLWSCLSHFSPTARGYQKNTSLTRKSHYSSFKKWAPDLHSKLVMATALLLSFPHPSQQGSSFPTAHSICDSELAFPSFSPHPRPSAHSMFFLLSTLIWRLSLTCLDLTSILTTFKPGHTHRPEEFFKVFISFCFAQNRFSLSTQIWPQT